VKPTFEQFVEEVRALMEPTAASKGYSTTGINGVNTLYEFVEDMAEGPGHALGEIVYKAKRYGKKRNPEDLLKIAAWAWLAYRHHSQSAVSTSPAASAESPARSAPAVPMSPTGTASEAPVFTTTQPCALTAVTEVGPCQWVFSDRVDK
jgi:hypothetical protein